MKWKPNMTPLERLLLWVDHVTQPVADYGPANDEMVRVEARDLYHLMQAKEAFEAAGPDAGGER